MKRPQYRLGQGGDYRPREGDLRARVAFLRVVEALVPDALAELRTVEAFDPIAIEAWCRRWGFVARTTNGVDWLRQTAASTTRALRARDFAESLRLDDDPPTPPDAFVATFAHWEPLVTVMWNPVTEPIAVFDERVAQAKREVATNPDLVPVTSKIVQPGHPWRDFEWLVLYQVAGWSYEAIAARYDPGNDAADDDAAFVSSEVVRTAVRGLASIVGVALRRGSRGRPKRPTPR